MFYNQKIMVIWIFLTVSKFYMVSASSCPDPGGVSNGNRVISDDGLSVSYTCHEGYLLSDGGTTYTRVKDDSGCWNGTTPYCNKIDCGDPGDIINGVKTGSQFLYNNEIEYECNTGYRLADGTRKITIICLPTGLWSTAKSSIFCSKVFCPQLDTVAFGEPPQDKYFYTDVVTYPCQDGYQRLMSETQLACQENGYWQGSYPQCEAESCPDPGEPDNGRRVDMTGLQFGAMVEYECRSGYQPFPHIDALKGTCTATGEWSNKDLQCKGKLCGVIEGVLNSTTIPENPTWRYPENVTFVCDPGFQPRFEEGQNTQITCDKRADESVEWDYAPTSCERITCSDTGEAQYVEISTRVYRYTEVKIYQCLGGFTLESGNLTRKCQEDGTFSGDPPICRRVGCADPGEFDHSDRTVSGLLFGDVISYTCNTGYIVGNRSGVLDQVALCTNNGTWDPPLERCKPAVCGLPDSQGLEVIGSSFLYTDEVEFRCKPGYVPAEADMTRRCQANGLWDGNPPLCQRRSCGDPGNVVYAEKLGSLYTFEEQILYQCIEGYTIVSGSGELTCTANGTWDGPLPTCDRVRCPEPEPIENGRVIDGYLTIYESTILYECLSGFAYIPNSGDLQRKCESSGSWSGKKPICDKISCGDPGFVNFTYRTGGSFLYGEKVNYSCVLGHTDQFKITSKIKTCNDRGEWEGEDIECEPIQCPTPGVKNATIQRMNGSSFYFDDTVRYSCIEGYIILDQKKELYCQHTGEWDAPIPDCVLTPVVDTGPEGENVEIEVTEAPDAEQYGLVGICLVAIELGVLVLLDLLTISKDIKFLAKNIRAGWRKLRPTVTPADVNPKEPPPLTDADLDMFLDDAWAYRAETPSGMSYDDMSNSRSTLQDMNDSTTELVPPSDPHRQLQILQALAAKQEAAGKGEKKRRIIVAS